MQVDCSVFNKGDSGKWASSSWQRGRVGMWLPWIIDVSSTNYCRDFGNFEWDYLDIGLGVIEMWLIYFFFVLIAQLTKLWKDRCACAWYHPLLDIIGHETTDMLSLEWQVMVHDKSRNDNNDKIGLAKFSHRLRENFLIFDQPLSFKWGKWFLIIFDINLYLKQWKNFKFVHVSSLY